MRFDVLTLHPDMLRGPLTSSILGRGLEAGAFELGIHDIREHGLGRHRSVDDAPYGGGAGMVMRVDVVASALEAVASPTSHVVLTSPAGPRLDQAKAQSLSKREHLVIVCGHYEGIDARIETLVDEEISLGDFVLTGAELVACAIVDSVARLLPGVLGNDASAVEESFTRPLLEHPHYTRPASWRGHDVPEVLRNGHHARIEAWRQAQAEERTRTRRPDLWARWIAQNVEG